MPRRPALLVAVLATALALAACGGDDPAAVDETPDGTEESTDGGADGAAAPPMEGAPPGELQVEQLVAPSDPNAREATGGDVVVVHYAGWAWSTGEKFDSSHDRGQPITFELGAQQVIPGWDQGIAGLQVGEQARLTIPPDLAYGEAGAGAAIGPDETLVFDVELVDVLDPEQPTGEG